MVLHVAVDVYVVERILKLFLEVVAQLLPALRLCFHLIGRDLAGRTESDDAGNVQRAGTHTAFVTSAVDLLRDLHARVAAAYVESANALRPIDLVTGERED